MADVFTYTDYRALLRDLYNEYKQTRPYFSYRFIGQKAGFKSAGYFTNIIAGKRNISSDLIFKFAELFQFNKKETEYFELLVLYDQAKQHAQKRYYYEKILAAAQSQWQTIAASQYEYFDKWYNVAIREILGFYPFRGDFKELAQLVRPAITPREAQSAIDLLKRLELITQDETGVYRVTSKAITTVPHVPLVAVHNFQLATLDLAKESIDRIARQERSISTLTFCASEETFKKIDARINELRQEVRELVKNDEGPINKAYHFNFQCFPISKCYTGPQK